jgi:dinuclear metal center protein, YbgI/SA1388 family
MKACDLIKPIEEFAPISFQEQWDNCGFSIGNPSAEISKVLIALDCTEEVMDEAIALNCEMIITHHPLIFGTLKSVTTENNIGKIISKGIKHNITVYSAHTNMDKASGGVSYIMAEKLRLINQCNLTQEGFGILGNLKESTNIESFIKLIKEKFCLDRIRCSKLLKKYFQSCSMWWKWKRFY